MVRWFWRTLLIGLLLLLVACGDSPQDLYETARLEERQFNQARAVQLYQRIVREFPDSPLADQARLRLEQLGTE